MFVISSIEEDKSIDSLKWQDGGSLKVSAALKASTACWGVGRNKK
jgi:hypothetical protein